MREGNSIKKIASECGTFYVSFVGVPEKFECDPENAYTVRPAPECGALFEPHIPDGVRVLPS